MKTRASPLALLLTAAMSQAQTVVNQTVNQLIPEGTPTGLASTIPISGDAGSIVNISVNLDITGTWNGDLYAYLVHSDSATGQTGFAVLLNRVGSTPTDIFGYGDSGMNVTFSDNAANGNIHYYQQVTVPAPGTQLTGAWAPDGRNVSPYTVTGTETPTALLSSFDGLSADGNWTLFVADVTEGNLSYLTSWGLDITTTSVPDVSSSLLLLLLALAGMFGWSAWRPRPRC
jgi:subtilisin-like proprotein convertase family protein